VSPVLAQSRSSLRTGSPFQDGAKRQRQEREEKREEATPLSASAQFSALAAAFIPLQPDPVHRLRDFG